MAATSLDKDKIKVLLLEGIHDTAVEAFEEAGYHTIERRTGAVPEAELPGLVRDVHFLGIRSRTQLTAEVLAAAERLVAVGAFCIGTNQVALEAAAGRGVWPLDSHYPPINASRPAGPPLSLAVVLMFLDRLSVSL